MQTWIPWNIKTGNWLTGAVFSSQTSVALLCPLTSASGYTETDRRALPRGKCCTRRKNHAAPVSQSSVLMFSYKFNSVRLYREKWTHFRLPGPRTKFLNRFLMVWVDNLVRVCSWKVIRGFLSVLWQTALANLRRYRSSRYVWCHSLTTSPWSCREQTCFLEPCLQSGNDTARDTKPFSYGPLSGAFFNRCTARATPDTPKNSLAAVECCKSVNNTDNGINFNEFKQSVHC